MDAANADAERDIELRKARFKSRLRRAARAAGYQNLFDLGRECGMSKDSFKKYMSGTRFPNFDCILKLSMTLGVPADWLMGADEESTLRAVLHARDIDRGDRSLLKGVSNDSGSCREAECEEELRESARRGIGQL